MKGNIADKFYTEGISYNPRDFYMCENEIDLTEDRVGPYEKTSKQTTKKAAEKLVKQVGNAASADNCLTEESNLSDNDDDGTS